MDTTPRFTTPSVLSSDRSLDLEGFITNTHVMAQAIRVLGSEAAAIRWLRTPAMGLNQQRPLDVWILDPQLVVDLLTRMEYGTYT